jgi:hypothetical protein
MMDSHEESDSSLDFLGGMSSANASIPYTVHDSTIFVDEDISEDGDIGQEEGETSPSPNKGIQQLSKQEKVEIIAGRSAGIRIGSPVLERLRTISATWASTILERFDVAYAELGGYKSYVMQKNIYQQEEQGKAFVVG